MTTTTTQPKQHDLLVWQWNINGLRGRTATLAHYRLTSEHAPTLPGYRTYALAHPKGPERGARVSGGVCTFIKKGITSLEHTLAHTANVEHLTVELVVGRGIKKEHVYVTNAYAKPRHAQQRYGTIVGKLKRLAEDHTTLLCGDFNAPHTEWGYGHDTAKRKSLLTEMQAAGYHLVNDVSIPARHAPTSVHRDTNPDLAFSNNAKVKWKNPTETLGSDHCLLELTVPLKDMASPKRTHKHTDWNAFRTNLANVPNIIDDIERWTEAIRREAKRAATELEAEDEVNEIDSRLAHLIEARNSLKRRRRTQKRNRTLRKRVALLNKEIEKHCAALNRQRWHAVCQEADGQLHKSRTWKLLRHLLDESKTKGEHQHVLARTLLKARRELGDDELNGKSVAGPDGVSNKELRNLSDEAITALTTFHNACWRSGTLPPKRKEARTALIPKPGAGACTT
ncbi:uncharacterized protein LOC144168324 [Haemaphysalis longicornis]